MKTYILLILAALIIVLGFSINATTNEEECCGKCTGSAYCTACKNCTRCAHCNSGGSCGVCSPGTTKPKPAQTYKAPKTLVANQEYIVSSDQLNIREKPSTSSNILYVLTKDAAVRVVETSATNDWVKIKYTPPAGKVITGYVLGSYLE